MPADVAKRAQFAVLIADHNDRFSSDVSCEKRLRVRNSSALTTGMIQRSRQLPAATEDFRLLRGQDSGVGVVAGLDGAGALDLLVEVERDGRVGHE